MPATLTARGIAVTRGRKTILDGIDLTVAPGQRIGLIGPNGVGKSTLLAVLSGELRAERGSITLAPPTAAVGWLHQEPERAEGETVRALLARRTGVAAADAELEAATEALAASRPGADDRYAAALERWLALGAADLDTRAEAVWSDLGLPAAILEQPTTTLSGGQAARAELAAVVLSRFDVYLLDEPTNDLDLDGLARLEAFVTGLAAGAVIVSHDRAFLERTVTHVYELDEHTRRGRRFGGGWAGYLDERAAARRHAEEAYERFTEKRDSLEGQVDRQREWARQGVAKVKKSDEKDKFIRHFRTTGAQGRAGVAAKIERAIGRLDQVDKPWEGWELRLDIANAGRSGDVVARLDGAVVHRGDFVLGPVDLEVHYGDRVAIVGANGSGKTTLLAALLGRVPLDAGERYLGPAVVVGELDQARQRLAPARPLLDAFLAATGLTVPEARSLLAKFGLGAEAVNRPPSRLSPGERTRAGLALFQATGVNCLVLDEPTNHLDLPAIEQLENALERFSGTLLLVSHDRRLLDAVATTRAVDVASGTVSERR